MNSLPTSPGGSPRPSRDPFAGAHDVDAAASAGGVDEFLGDVLPDLGTNFNEDVDIAVERAVGGSARLTPEGVYVDEDGVIVASEAVTEAPEAPAGQAGGIPAGEPVAAPSARGAGVRITNEAEKAGFGANSPQSAPAEAAVGAAKRGPGRPVSGLAYQGKTAVVPDKPVAVTERSSRISAWMESYSPFQKDFHDMVELNKEIGMVSRAMMEVEWIYGQLAAYERELSARYESAKSRAMVEVTGSTEKTRTAYAEILVEELKRELDDVHLEVVRAERSQRMLGRHLDALTVISNNLRAGFRIV